MHILISGYLSSGYKTLVRFEDIAVKVCACIATFVANRLVREFIPINKPVVRSNKDKSRIQMIHHKRDNIANLIYSLVHCKKCLILSHGVITQGVNRIVVYINDIFTAHKF